MGTCIAVFEGVDPGTLLFPSFASLGALVTVSF